MLTVRLAIVVTQTRWTSAYDLHAQTDGDGQPGGSVSFRYRARVAQTTGEDWKDTTLILSTSTSDALARGIPDARNLHVKPIPRIPPPTFGGLHPPPLRRLAAAMPPPPSAPAPRPNTGESDSDGESGVLDFGNEMPEMMEATTRVGKSAVSMTFTVEGNSSVPTDGVLHQLSIATLALDATTSHVVVPRVEAAAYLLVGLSFLSFTMLC